MDILFGVLSGICLFIGIIFSVLSMRYQTEKHPGSFSWKCINPFVMDKTSEIKMWFTPKIYFARWVSYAQSS